MRDRLKELFKLHILLAVVSCTSIFSKLAAGEPFLSFRFCLFYGSMIFILGIYAIAWQQILRKLPLVTAYANKAVSVIWGLVWGALFFRESITLVKLLGCAIIIAGVLVMETEGE